MKDRTPEPNARRRLSAVSCLLLALCAAGAFFLSCEALDIRGRGAISITTQPTGCEVYLDGEATGDTTNCLLVEITAGAHLIKLVKSDYISWQDSVDVNHKDTVQIFQVFKGDLQVNSDPPGAQIWLDGDSTGFVASHLFKDLLCGSHAVSLVMEGYARVDTSVVVVNGGTATLNTTLDATFGSIQVNSTPSGAEIWLDGFDTGHETNYLLSNVSVGNHEVKLIKNSYEDYIDTVTIIAGQTALVDAVLEQSVGNLGIKSSPTGASITLDGVPTSFSTDAVIYDVPVGFHIVELLLSGYSSWVDTVEVNRGQTTTVNANLSQYGKIQVNSTPTSADIWLDGTQTGYKTNYLLTDIDAGQHIVKLTLEYYKDWQQTVTVNEGQTTTVDANLELLGGFVHMTSTPSGALAYVDGVSTGQTTPCFVQVDDEDFHLFNLELAGYGDCYRAAAVNYGDTTDVSCELLPRIKFDDFESYADGSYPSAGGWYHGLPPYGVEAFVTNALSKSGTRSFKLVGSSGGARVDCLNYNWGSYNKVSYGLWLYLPDNPTGTENSSCGPAKMMSDHVWKWDAVNFAPDGYIYIGWSEGDPQELTKCQSYQTDRWYRVDVEIDYNANTVDVWIDGVYKQTIDARSGSAPTFALWTSCPAVYYDDVQLCGD